MGDRGCGELGRSQQQGRSACAVPAGISVEIVRRSGLWREMLPDDSFLVHAARAAIATGIPESHPDYELSLLLTSDVEIRALNQEWRGKDGPTNVLSFPMEPPSTPDGHARLLGDVAMAAETVRREAFESDRTVAQHAAHLVVHGVLHLLGFDHLSEEDAVCMEALEVRALESLGIPNPYLAAGRVTPG